MKKKTNDILDLQVFLGKPSGQRTVVPEGMPSFISQSMQRMPLREFSPQRTQSLKEEKMIADQSYIAIANSNVVEEIQFPLYFESVIRLINGLASNQIRLRECMNFGSHLFDFIFERSIRDLYRQLSGNLKEQKLRITLATTVPELAFLPWELICDSQSGKLPQFLCYHPNLHLCRALRLFDRAEFVVSNLGEECDLRILLVTSNPLIESYIDIGTEERLLSFIIDDQPPLNKITFRSLHDADINSLRDLLISYKPHIVHFACHGGYDSKEELGYVVLCSTKNPRQPDLVNSYRFASLIQEPGTIQLVFINSCYGAIQSTVSAFSGTAQCLHASGVDDVVALQFPLQDKTAHAIVLNFYKYLLRDNLSVEDCVSQVRKYLFINGYISPESFGLTLFQGNKSLVWPGGIPISRKSSSEEKDFSDIVEAFQTAKKLAVQVKLSTELQKIKKSLRDLDTLTPEDLLLAKQVFDDLEIAFEILRKVKQANTSLPFFLKMAKLSTILCHTPYERKLVATTFIVQSVDDIKDYQKKHKNVSQVLSSDFLLGEIRNILSTAIKVNGENRAFVVINAKDKDKFITYVENISDISDNEINSIDNIGDPKWNRVRYKVREHGCAFILPGDSRVKVIIEGEQLAEYRFGKWSLSNLRKLRNSVVNVAQQKGLNEDIAVDIVKKCVQSSEEGRGLTFVIQIHDEVLSKCHPGYLDVINRDDMIELKSKKITDFKRKEYLDLVYGDNAVILSSEGYTLAVNASLATSPTTEVNVIPGTGSRHLFAQKFTKETDAIAIVVSEDGPITVFQNGEIVVRIL